MAVYVDALFTMAPKGKKAARYGNQWCHMWSDTPEELHAMASVIGLKRSYFQDKPTLPHYDLVPSKRELALKHGAIEGSLLDAIRSRKPHLLKNDI